MLLVQQYLETHTFGDLAKEHGVYASFSKSGHKFSLNYDQIEAKESDPLAQECRGLILALRDGRPVFGMTGLDGKIDRSNIEPGPTVVLAYPMKRFFNHGQGSAAPINWSDPNLAVLEKLDGTLCIVYYDWFTKQWCVATRSVPEADLLMDNGIFTFRTLFEKALQETVGTKQYWGGFDYFCSSNLSPNCTYCFELTTPYNRIVVNYPNNGITLLAVRHMPNLQELELNHSHLSYLSKIVPVVQAYTYTRLEELLDWVSSLDPSQHEGVVIRDVNFNRIKIKNAAYVAASKCRDTLGASQRNCIELILLGKEDDVISLLPQEIVNNIISLKERYKIWLRRQQELYNSIYSEAAAISPDKKTFALTVQKYKPNMSGMFFSIFDHKAISVKDFIDKNQPFSASFLDKILGCIDI